MATKVIPMHATEGIHLAEVTAEMVTLGAPSIRAIWMECYGAWVALEGTHRIAAAKALGIEPVIVAVEYDENVTAADLGLDWEDQEALVSDVADSAHRRAYLAVEV